MPENKDKSAVHIHSPTLLLLVMFATAGALLYLQFLVAPSNRGDLIPYLMVLAAESFIVFHALTALWTILAGTKDTRNFEFHDAQAHLFTSSSERVGISDILLQPDRQVNNYRMYLHKKPVSIDVFVTVYGESVDLVRKTVLAARDIVGYHKTYVLDDGESDEIMSLANQLNVSYIRRSGSEGAKAGNINNALKQTTGDFFVIFDADFVAKKNFLYETLPFFEDPNVAFVQTPQAYSNLNTVISRGADYIQRVFYKLIQPGKNRFNAAFCVGTNVVFRRSAIERIGGMYQKSKSEDIWTSLLLHEKGYRSVYVDDVLAVGKTPDTIKAYSKQQLRWSTGGFQIFFKRNPLFRPLSLDQKIQYLHTSSYYFHGLAVFLLILLPPLHIYFDLTPVTIQVAFVVWLIYYLLFYGLQVVLAFYTMGGFRWETIVLPMVSFPIYVRALINSLRGKEEAWQATNNRSGIDSPFNYIVPQVMLFVFLLIATFVGAWKIYYYETFNLALFWCALNTLLLGSFIFSARKEHARLKVEARRPAQAQRPARVVPVGVLSGSYSSRKEFS